MIRTSALYIPACPNAWQGMYTVFSTLLNSDVTSTLTDVRLVVSALTLNTDLSLKASNGAHCVRVNDTVTFAPVL